MTFQRSPSKDGPYQLSSLSASLICECGIIKYVFLLINLFRALYKQIEMTPSRSLVQMRWWQDNRQCGENPLIGTSAGLCVCVLQFGSEDEMRSETGSACISVPGPSSWEGACRWVTCCQEQKWQPCGWNMSMCVYVSVCLIEFDCI